MAVKTSPRLRALLYSNPSGKPAVFAPRLNRVNTLERTRRSKNTKDKPIGDTKSGSSPKLTRGRNPNEKKPVVSKESSQKRQRTLTSSAKTGQTGHSRMSKRGEILGGDERKWSTEVATKCKQRKSKALVSSINKHPNMDRGRDNIVTTDNISPSVGVRRKRGRPPKNTTSYKRVKIAAGTESEVMMDDTLSRVKDFIDLTCDDEAVGDDDIDAAITPSTTSTNLIQRSSAISLSSTNCTETRDHPDKNINGDSNANIASDDIESDDYHRMSLDSDETIAQLFDLGVMKGDTTSSDMIAVPSLKRSRNINPSIAKEESSFEQAPQLENVSDEAPDSLSSPTEEYPQPSTPQQKFVRHLARQKQLEEMRAREAALLREERLLRRKGILPSAEVTQSSAKRISWRDETDLVEMFIYSPVKDDDDDTVSIHSNDAINMEMTLSALEQ